jgi:2-oxoisovalerate dehydrogenase E2 component (dihydrolipoyl transacylase)
MAETRVTLPQLGESVHEGTISRWLVKPGERVTEFEPMVEVDTDKVSAEVPAPVTGVLKEIIAKEGETVQAGAEIAVVELDESGERPAGGADGQKEAKAAEKPTPAAAKEAPPADEPAPAAAPEAPAAEKTAAAPPTPEPRPAAAAAAQTVTAASGEHRFSPAVQMLAEENHLDLGQVQGTGLAGRVTKKDVLRHLQSNATAPVSKPAPVAAVEGDEVVPLNKVRRLIAENMVRSKSTIPHAWQTQEVDMSGVVASRAASKGRLQAEEGIALTYLPYVVKAAAVALREHPHVNATFNQTELLVHRAINIGISVGLEDTLIVPVIRSADGLSIAGLARAIADVAERARTKKVTADDLQGGTFTVNNSGTFGTLFSYSVINPGQAGILTMEAIVQRPVAVDGMIGVKPMMYLCFSFDHRVLDGLQAARFLTSCRKWLEAVSAETPIY